MLSVFLFCYPAQRIVAVEIPPATLKNSPNGNLIEFRYVGWNIISDRCDFLLTFHICCLKVHTEHLARFTIQKVSCSILDPDIYYVHIFCGLPQYTHHNYVYFKAGHILSHPLQIIVYNVPICCSMKKRINNSVTLLTLKRAEDMVIRLSQWYSTFFVRVPPDIISLQLCTPKVVGT
jgi:hypothetical protein